MPLVGRLNVPISRRRFLRGAAASFAASGSLAAPAFSRANARPQITHGLQSGDVTTDSGIVWARADRPARLIVEAATSDSFADIVATEAVDALPETDFTAKLLLDELPPGQTIFYRARFQDLASPATMGEPVTGRFRTPPAGRRSVSFLWSGDTAGQGWGIDESLGGMRTYATMRRAQPDFFIHCGDHIYADCPIPATRQLRDGRLWRNIVTPEKSKVAETLGEFRGNYRYNLLDTHVRAFNAEVPLLAQWDDHEVTNDWAYGESVHWDGYRETSMLKLAAYGRRAFREYMPVRDLTAEGGRVYRKIAYGPLLDVFLVDMRSYRTSNPNSDAALIFGDKQLRWLKRELARSTASWKVIAADLPIGLISGDAIARGDGAPFGREHEVADLLRALKRAGVRNVVWLTADMHYTAAHYYDPHRASFQDFEPFWEFVSGPLHAGSWSKGTLDNTFGPREVFAKGCSADQGDNLAPCFGLQFFGQVAIDGESEAMTVTLKDVGDNALFAVTIDKQERPAALAHRLGD